MKKKQYAPLVSEQTYYYEQRQNSNTFIAHSTKLPNIEEQKGKRILVYCPKCHGTHIIKPSDTRHQSISDWEKNMGGSKFKCPHCGHYDRVEYYSYYRDYPEKAIIFKMADNSMAISIIVVRESIYLAKHQGSEGIKEVPIHHKRRMRYRIIFSSNGQTYVKHPVWIKSNYLVNVCRGKKKTNIIRNVTYNLSFSRLMFQDAIRPLIRDGIISEYQNFKNRFRGVSELYIKQLTTLQNISTMYYEYFPKALVKVLHKIKMYDTDETVYHKIMKCIDMVPKTKLFKKYSYQDPLGTYFAWRCYNNLGMKDINSFYKFVGNSHNNMIRSIGSYANGQHEKQFMLGYIERYGETVLANILSNQKKLAIFLDASEFAKRMQWFNKDYATYYRKNIKEMHDALQEAYHQDTVRREQIRSITTVLRSEKYINSCAERQNNYDLIFNFKNHVVKTYEHIFNSIISYIPEERKFEREYDGVKFYLPPDTDHLLYAGDKLHNCVGSCYRLEALHKSCTIVLMKENDRLVGCIEVNSGKIRQAYGPCNTEFKGKYANIYRRWEKDCGFSALTENKILAPIHRNVFSNINGYEEKLKKIKEKARELGINEDEIGVPSSFCLATPF